MASTVSSQAQDVATARPGVIALGGQQIVAQEQVLVRDEFEGSTVDTSARWTVTTASGGTINQSSAAGCVLSTSTNTAGSAILQSNTIIPYLAGSEISLRASAKFATVGIAQNTRELALRVDGNNYAEFILDGTSFLTRVYSGGSAFAADATITTVLADDLTGIDFEIRVSRSPDRVHFIVNDQQIASYVQRGSSTRLFQGMLAQAYFRTLNAGSSADNVLYLDSVLITRRWNAYPQNVQVKRLTASGIVCRGPCFYLGAYRKAGSTTFVSVYDNVSAAGTQIDETSVSSPNYMMHPLTYPLFCSNGIYINYGAGTDAVYCFYLA